MLLNNLFNAEYIQNAGLSGLTDESFCLYVNELFQKSDKSILIVTGTLFEASNLLNILNNLCEDTLFFPMDDFLTSEAISMSPDLMVTRLETLNELLKNNKRIVITHMMGYLRYLPSKNTYLKNILELKVGNDYNPKDLTRQLYNLGYVRETLVTKTGEVGVRGFVIDVFPVNEIYPIRLEFFGDEIESIRYFDPENQKSIESLNEITIYPYTEFLLDNYEKLDEDTKKQKYLANYSDSVKNILDYLLSPIIFIKDYVQIGNQYKHMLMEIDNYIETDPDYNGEYMHSFNLLEIDTAMHYLSVDNLIPNHKFREFYDFHIKEISKFHENIDLINHYLIENIEFRKKIIIFLKEYQIKNFIKHLTVPYVLTDFNNIKDDLVNIVAFDFNKGFIYNDYIILTDKDLFNINVTKKKYKTKFKYTTKINDINKLEIGDYIVHSIHGIGVYQGIKTLESMGFKKDFLEISYKGNDKLYIPVEKISLISKYSGKEGIVPHINSLSGSEWRKNKQRVIDKVKDIANKLIKLYAERESRKGFAFSKDTKYHEEFYNNFEYTLTADQVKAYDEIKNDMERERPMDRLLCGDVGFGKTEVAFRAMFKAVYDGKQVLYLCPTTILSNQQYKNAIERFKGFPVNIEILNRFTSVKKVKETINKLKNGTVDIVIGTHRLLGGDVRAKNLGLLVIDEEQRFGVTHKEKIKEYKSNVDVLTLTATPIPRTLQMSLVGIRGLSLIKTPPINRYPVQTYVVFENDGLIKDAIVKEISRDGQIFILYNRVEYIDNKMDEIRRLVPSARIVCVHGQLSKTELEDRMQKFINHEYDILLCTTIIETGIDISNVNTLIVLDADRFGLSQLYQIRGRVGRSNKIAYAYLMYGKNKILGDSAIKRLNALKEFTELGSGYQVASRDLNIRGAGDILGSEQAGFVDTVGIDLYLKILNDEIKRTKGEVVLEEEIREEKPLINVTTHIDDHYTTDSDLKIEIHKMINTIDSYEKLLDVKSEFEDRFGKINDDILVYMHQEWFEKLAKEMGIEKVIQSKKDIKLIFDIDMSKQINNEELFMRSFEISKYFTFNYSNLRLNITLDTRRLEKHYIYYLIDLIKDIKIKV